MIITKEILRSTKSAQSEVTSNDNEKLTKLVDYTCPDKPVLGEIRGEGGVGGIAASPELSRKMIQFQASHTPVLQVPAVRLLAI